MWLVFGVGCVREEERCHCGLDVSYLEDWDFLEWCCSLRRAVDDNLGMDVSWVFVMYWLCSNGLEIQSSNSPAS